MDRGGSITTRLIALLTLCAAVIIGVGMLVDFHLSRKALLESLQRESDETIRSVIVDMEQWLEGVKSSTLLLARVIAQREYSEQGLEQILRDAVEVNADIFGAAIALAPDQASTELGFAPYYFRSGGEIQYNSLADSDHNYQQQAWFLDAVTAGKPLWVEPYYDRAGAKVLMTTYSIPVYREDPTGQRFLYAVVTADVALAQLHDNLQRLALGRSGFGILLSRSGVILSGRNPANIMRHYSHKIIGEPDQTTWQLMFDAALKGQVVSQQLSCIDRPGQCVMRLGSLQSTGWPVGVMYSEDEMLAPLRSFQWKTGLIGFFTLLLMAAAVIIVTRRLTRPLTALALASDRIAQGDLEAPLPAASGNDEVARLIQSFAAMKRDLKSYIADLETATARRSRLEGELGAARDIQMAMLPPGGDAVQPDESCQLWARVLPARSVGGDLYYYHRRGRLLFIAVGDVSDKGVPAALFMARAISLIQQLAVTTANPGAALAELNDALASSNDNCMFVTLFLGVLDLDRLELQFGSAGHTAPSLVRGSAVSSLPQDQGPAMGLAAHLSFPANSLQLQPGDRLAIFTDGIDEAFNEEDEMFGIERCNQTLLAGRTLPAARAGKDLFDRLATFAGSRPQSDDIGLLLLDIAVNKETPLQASGEFSRGPRLTSTVEKWLDESLAPLALPEQARSELSLVVEEIVSNVDKYATLSEDASILLDVEASNREVEIEIRDEGLAFNPLVEAQQANLGATIEDTQIGGLGVHLITALTDRQSYRREGGCNILRVTKFLIKHPD
jgi:sigma-B regulation protein RsbU (phosphoserine phosphatase)